MNSYEIGTMVGNVVGWAGVIVLIGLGVWFVGAVLYFTYLDIKDIPNRRASKAMNARVDAVKAANRARVHAELDRLYPQRLAYRAAVAAENDAKWWKMVGRRD